MKKGAQQPPAQSDLDKANAWMAKMNKIFDKNAFPKILAAVRANDFVVFEKECKLLKLEDEMIKEIWRMADPDKGRPGFPCW